MRLALYLPPEPNRMWTLAAQLGVTHAVTQLPAASSGGPKVWDFQSLLLLKQRFADAGLEATVIEDSPPMELTRRGLPGRDAEIDGVCELLTNMGAAGITIWCYNWMAVFGWLRTSTTTPGRGGALVSSYDHALMEGAPRTAAGTVSEDQLWDAYAYFLDKIIPVAEVAGVKLALHPDDPPLSPIRGVRRIMRSVANFDRALALHPSPAHGITFCQGNFTAMGADIPATIRHFANQGKIHFAHFRDVRGTAERFIETFHDDGPTDMLAAMQAYVAAGLDVPIRPDHVPTLAGDANDTPGYTERGRLYAIGYMRGLLEAATVMQSTNGKQG